MIVVLRDVMDNTVKGPRDFEDLNVPVLGHVPFDKRVAKTPIAFRGDPHGPRSEAYRQLRTNLQFVDVDNPPRVIAVTSALPGEGKTTHGDQPGRCARRGRATGSASSRPTCAARRSRAASAWSVTSGSPPC